LAAIWNLVVTGRMRSTVLNYSSDGCVRAVVTAIPQAVSRWLRTAELRLS